MTVDDCENIEDFSQLDEAARDKVILQITARNAIDAQEDGVYLNEGYSFSINGSIPQFADALAKMLIEMNKDPEFGEKAGDNFLTLLDQYYQRLKGE